MIPSLAMGVDTTPLTQMPTTPDFMTTDAILSHTPDDTECATGVFANALYETSGNVSETDSETTIRQWIYETFRDPDVLRDVLMCPEFAQMPDDETIHFLPIEYTFPGGRKIVINYETQPKILRDRITIGEKRDLPFVGPGKHNTISLQYIEENIDNLFPHGSQCTGKSALTNDNTMINRAMRETVNLSDDTNDYYVAGDVNLQWISYAEIALDVAITVITVGGGTVILGATKAARASRALHNLTSVLRTLRQTDSVRDYIRLGQQLSRANAELRAINRATDATAYANKLAEVERLTATMRNLENTDDNVRRYRQATQAYSSLNQYRRALRSLRPAQRGNIIAKTWRAVRATGTGASQIRNANKIARGSTLSARARDWLFDSTLANAGLLARMERAGGLLYGTLKFVGGMYDWTETSTGDFTSDIEFKPLTLLSADDLQGQENVINHGMWLMWAGDSYSAADDDSAYLQAMDFANKFHYNLDKIQNDTNDFACDVDIYVVRPIIRNPGTENPELYYLIMNDEPWTTRDTDSE